MTTPGDPARNVNQDGPAKHVQRMTAWSWRGRAGAFGPCSRSRGQDQRQGRDKRHTGPPGRGGLRVSSQYGKRR
jgi:hypothetical protein